MNERTKYYQRNRPWRADILNDGTYEAAESITTALGDSWKVLRPLNDSSALRLLYGVDGRDLTLGEGQYLSFCGGAITVVNNSEPREDQYECDEDGRPV